jgi:hypothetical protein
VTAPPYTLEFYEDEDGHEPVLDWLRKLTPRKRRAIGVAMFEILQYGGPHVVGTNFGKGLGGGFFEFRLDQDASQVLARKGKKARPEGESAKILLRVFCHAHGDQIVLLVGATTRASGRARVISRRRSSWRGRDSRHGKLDRSGEGPG